MLGGAGRQRVTADAEGCMQGQDADRDAVEGVIKAFFAGITGYDYQAMSRCAAECLIIEHDQRMTTESLMAMMKDYEGKAVFTYALEDFVTTVDGATAWTTYNNHGVLTAGEQKTQYEFAETAVLRQDGGAWRIVLLHSTRLKP